MDLTSSAAESTTVYFSHDVIKIPDRQQICFRLDRNYAKCVLSVVQDTVSSTDKIPYRLDDTGYGTVPLHP